MKTIYKASAWVLTGLGILHTVLTPLFYSSLTEDALWFAGTGLGLLFLGLFNLAMLRAPAAHELCLAANILGSVFGILIVVVMPAPQALLALLAFLGVTVGCVFARVSLVR
ncbi:MAG TPA: hypothetical protein VKP08_14740 [Anaerolineales bacterium]|nr:hypothetical protein [Anaerolineales bacterium]